MCDLGFYFEGGYDGEVWLDEVLEDFMMLRIWNYVLEEVDVVVGYF